MPFPPHHPLLSFECGSQGFLVRPLKRRRAVSLPTFACCLSSLSFLTSLLLLEMNILGGDVEVGVQGWVRVRSRRPDLRKYCADYSK